MINTAHRELQREILTLLSHSYPDQVVLDAPTTSNENEYRANYYYLHSHGLIEIRELINRTYGKITAKGIDFLADDGGLGAILGVQVIKIHDDTIKKLLIEKIEATDADTTIKGNLIEQIKSLPASALNTITQRLIERGLDHLPSQLSELHKLLPF